MMKSKLFWTSQSSVIFQHSEITFPMIIFSYIISNKRKLEEILDYINNVFLTKSVNL